VCWLGGIVGRWMRPRRSHGQGNQTEFEFKFEFEFEFERQPTSTGIDSFDCVHPTRIGRHGCALVMAHFW
jgi:hypothetical protein